MQKSAYTSGDVARILGIPARTVRRYLMSGKILAAQNPITGTWMISHEALLAFLRSHNLDPSYLAKPIEVLIVDDDPAIIKFITAALNESGGTFDIDSTTDGYEALVKLGSGLPDIVILDIRMPGTDGRRVLEAIKSNERTAAIKILVISGFHDDIGEMIKMGADDALTKPFNDIQLIEKILRLIPGLQRRMMASL